MNQTPDFNHNWIVPVHTQDPQRDVIHDRTICRRWGSGVKTPTCAFKSGLRPLGACSIAVTLTRSLAVLLIILRESPPATQDIPPHFDDLFRP